jgi:hypothetical protein
VRAVSSPVAEDYGAMMVLVKKGIQANLRYGRIFECSILDLNNYV